jgi:hypothetical protein
MMQSYVEFMQGFAITLLIAMGYASGVFLYCPDGGSI